MKRSLLAGLLLWFIGASAALATPKDEIEALLLGVSNRCDVVFIRNDTEYTPVQAVAHLRLKWSKQESAIKTAEDFITRCATQSSMSGKAYLIRFKDGHTEPASDVLKQDLAKLRANPKRG